MKQHHFNTDNVVKEFGINVREELALVDARVLPPPTVYIVHAHSNLTLS